MKKALQPESTTQLYTRVQKEFVEWCEVKYEGQPDCFTVTGPKLHLFLVEKVVGRDKYRGTGTISAGSISAYITGITSLWKEQYELGINSHGNPRFHSLVVAVRRNASQQQVEVDRRSLSCRFRNSFLDGAVSVDELISMFDQFMKQGRLSDLKHRLACVMSYSAALRGQTTRHIELSDLALLEIPSDGPERCKALVIIIKRGKRNKFGRIEYGSGIRTKDAEICPLGALALYLFARYQASGSGLPDFSDKKNWHFIKVIPGSVNAGRRKRRAKDDENEEQDMEEEMEVEEEEEDDDGVETVDQVLDAQRAYIGGLTLEEYEAIKKANPEIDYQSQLQAISKVLRKLNISSSSKTHFFRHASAKTAELQGAPEDEIRRLGRWNNQSLEGVYLSPIPLRAARSLAGFKPNTNDYCLPRGSIDPPEELQQMIFPEIEEWTAKLDEVPAHFFKLLKFLRIVLLQDAVVLMKKFPNLKVYKHPLFKTDLFKSFAAELYARVQAARVNQFGPSMSAAAPEIVEALNAMTTSLSGDIAGSATAINGSISTGFQNLRQNIEVLAQDQNRQAALLINQLLSFHSASLPNDLRQGLEEILRRPSTTIAPADVPTSSAVITPRRDRSSNSVQVYSMDRNLTSICDVWREYDCGINNGPSIRSLDQTHNSKWRNGETDRKFYSSQEIWYKNIPLLATKLRISNAAAAQRLEDFRLRIGFTIPQLRMEVKGKGIDFCLNFNQQ